MESRERERERDRTQSSTITITGGVPGNRRASTICWATLRTSSEGGTEVVSKGAEAGIQVSAFSFSPVRHQGRGEHKAEDKEGGIQALPSSWPPERPFLELLF